MEAPETAGAITMASLQTRRTGASFGSTANTSAPSTHGALGSAPRSSDGPLRSMGRTGSVENPVPMTPSNPFKGRQYPGEVISVHNPTPLRARGNPPFQKTEPSTWFG